MRYWNRESPRSRAKLSSIFTAIGTIYRPRSGSNSNAGGWAHRQGPKRFYQGNSRGPRSTREHTLSGSRNLSAHCAATTSEMCQRITMLAHRPGIHRPSLDFNAISVLFHFLPGCPARRPVTRRALTLEKRKGRRDGG